MNAYLGRHRGGRRGPGRRWHRGGFVTSTPLWYDSMPYVAPTCYRDGQGRVWCLQQQLVPALGAEKGAPAPASEPKRWYQRPLLWAVAGAVVMLTTV